jgi:hypothetical protein
MDFLLWCIAMADGLGIVGICFLLFLILDKAESSTPTGIHEAEWAAHYTD